jgi:hypothetical protein
VAACGMTSLLLEAIDYMLLVLLFVPVQLGGMKLCLKASNMSLPLPRLD